MSLKKFDIALKLVVNTNEDTECYLRFWQQATKTEQHMEVELYNVLARQLPNFGPSAFAELRFCIGKFREEYYGHI